jgi:hypothetical protein
MFLAAGSVIATRGPLCGPAIAILGYASGGAVEERLPQWLAISGNGFAMDSQAAGVAEFDRHKSRST